MADCRERQRRSEPIFLSTLSRRRRCVHSASAVRLPIRLLSSFALLLFFCCRLRASRNFERTFLFPFPSSPPPLSLLSSTVPPLSPRGLHPPHPALATHNPPHVSRRRGPGRRFCSGKTQTMARWVTGRVWDGRLPLRLQPQQGKSCGWKRKKGARGGRGGGCDGVCVVRVKELEKERLKNGSKRKEARKRKREKQKSHVSGRR